MQIRQAPSGPIVALPTSVAEFDNGDATNPDAIDWSKGPAQKIRLVNNAALNLYIGLTANQPTWLQLKVKQDGTGSRIPTLPGVLVPGGTPLTFSTAAGATDILSLYYDGALLYATIGGLAFA
jgi:hypothetical protein